MSVVETQRLRLRQLTLDDRDFLIELLNDRDFLRHIGDKGVRNRADARKYLETGPLAAYRELGFGLYCVETKAESTAIGICGLVSRDGLDAVDIGFAYLPDFRGRGYGYEAGLAVLDYAREELALDRVVAVTSPENIGSIALLRKLGLEFDRSLRLPGDTRDCQLFVPADGVSSRSR